MFVRKGTVSRKTRGSGRKSTRRPARDSGSSHRKGYIHEDSSSTASGTFRNMPNGDAVSPHSFRELPDHDSISMNSIRELSGDEQKHSSHRAEFYDPVPHCSTHNNHVIRDVTAHTSAHNHLVHDVTQHNSAYNHAARDVSPYHSAHNHRDVTSHNGTYNHVTRDVRYHDQVKPSPARSIAQTLVSYDDDRQLVRTSVGWECHEEGAQPDYGAFMYQIHEAGKEADHVVDFVGKVTTIICNTLFVTVLVGLMMGVPIAMVSVGVKYLSDCPKEPRVPVYLLVGGCFGMIKLLSTLWRNIQYRRYQDMEVMFDDHDSDGAVASTTYRTMDNILFLFLLGWHAVGTYWTCTIWKPHFKQLLHEPSNWCDRTVYMFAVYQQAGCYGIMVLYVMVLCMCSCCYKCSK